MKKNVKNIAYIQNKGILSNEQIKKYMGDIKYLTSDDSNIIYKFIVCCNKCYKITKFCLMINSEILKDLNLLIQKNRKLDKCIFFATYSSANSVRDVIAKNIYFSLSSLSVILNGFENIATGNVMTIVSDANTPYYNQIYNTGPKPAYRISQLTVEKVNEFVDSGNAIDMLIALDDFAILTKILLDPTCKYKNFATFIDLASFNNPFIEKLSKKLARINTISSNVSLVGLTNAYPDLSSTLLYTNSAIQFVNFYKQWDKFIERAIVFNRFTKIYKNNKLATKALTTAGGEYSTNISSISTNNIINSGNFFCVALSSISEYGLPFMVGIAGNDSTTSTNLSPGMYYSNNYTPNTSVGQNWTQGYTEGNTVFISVALSGLNGIACPDGGTSGIIYSIDGGETWIQSNNLTDNFTCVSLSGSNAIAGTDDNSSNLGIYYSNTEPQPGTSTPSPIGQNWTQSTLQNGSLINDNFSLNSIALSGSNGIAGSGSSKGIYYTTDSGKTWSSSNITSGSFNCVALSGLNGIAASVGNSSGGIYTYSIYYTSNGGQYWILSGLNDGLNTVFISSDGNYGIACSNGGNGIYYTNNSTPNTFVGQNWTQSTLNTGGVLTGLTGNFFSAVLSGTNGIAGSFAGNGLYYTTDSGQTWTQSYNLTNSLFNTGSFYSVALIGSNGIAGGSSNNGIWYTTDGGANWTQSNES